MKERTFNPFLIAFGITFILATAMAIAMLGTYAFAFWTENQDPVKIVKSTLSKVGDNPVWFQLNKVLNFSVENQTIVPLYVQQSGGSQKISKLSIDVSIVSIGGGGGGGGGVSINGTVISLNPCKTPYECYESRAELIPKPIRSGLNVIIPPPFNPPIFVPFQSVNTTCSMTQECFANGRTPMCSPENCANLCMIRDYYPDELACVFARNLQAQLGPLKQELVKFYKCVQHPYSNSLWVKYSTPISNYTNVTAGNRLFVMDTYFDENCLFLKNTSVSEEGCMWWYSKVYHEIVDCDQACGLDGWGCKFIFPSQVLPNGKYNGYPPPSYCPGPRDCLADQKEAICTKTLDYRGNPDAIVGTCRDLECNKDGYGCYEQEVVFTTGEIMIIPKIQCPTTQLCIANGHTPICEIGNVFGEFVMRGSCLDICVIQKSYDNEDCLGSPVDVRMSEAYDCQKIVGVQFDEWYRMTFFDGNNIFYSTYGDSACTTLLEPIYTENNDCRFSHRFEAVNCEDACSDDGYGCFLDGTGFEKPYKFCPSTILCSTNGGFPFCTPDPLTESSSGSCSYDAGTCCIEDFFPIENNSFVDLLVPSKICANRCNIHRLAPICTLNRGETVPILSCEDFCVERSNDCDFNYLRLGPMNQCLDIGDGFFAIYQYTTGYVIEEVFTDSACTVFWSYQAHPNAECSIWGERFRAINCNTGSNNECQQVDVFGDTYWIPNFESLDVIQCVTSNYAPYCSDGVFYCEELCVSWEHYIDARCDPEDLIPEKYAGGTNLGILGSCNFYPLEDLYARINLLDDVLLVSKFSDSACLFFVSQEIVEINTCISSPYPRLSEFFKVDECSYIDTRFAKECYYPDSSLTLTLDPNSDNAIGCDYNPACVIINEQVLFTCGYLAFGISIMTNTFGICGEIGNPLDTSDAFVIPFYTCFEFIFDTPANRGSIYLTPFVDDVGRSSVELQYFGGDTCDPRFLINEAIIVQGSYQCLFGGENIAVQLNTNQVIERIYGCGDDGWGCHNARYFNNRLGVLETAIMPRRRCDRTNDCMSSGGSAYCAADNVHGSDPVQGFCGDLVTSIASWAFAPSSCPDRTLLSTTIDWLTPLWQVSQCNDFFVGTRLFDEGILFPVDYGSVRLHYQGKGPGMIIAEIYYQRGCNGDQELLATGTYFGFPAGFCTGGCESGCDTVAWSSYSSREYWCGLDGYGCPQEAGCAGGGTVCIPQYSCESTRACMTNGGVFGAFLAEKFPQCKSSVSGFAQFGFGACITPGLGEESINATLIRENILRSQNINPSHVIAKYFGEGVSKIMKEKEYNRTMRVENWKKLSQNYDIMSRRMDKRALLNECVIGLGLIYGYNGTISEISIEQGSEFYVPLSSVIYGLVTNFNVDGGTLFEYFSPNDPNFNLVTNVREGVFLNVKIDCPTQVLISGTFNMVIQ
jgi:hypothetical protein